MNDAKAYVANARKQGLDDDDIIMELTKEGWAIPDIHKLLYVSGNPTAQQMFAKNPVVTMHHKQAEQAMKTAQQKSQQAVQPAQTQLVPTPKLPQQPPQSTATAPKKKSRLKKVIIFTVIGLLIFALGAGAGIGAAYWYVQKQLAAYSGFATGQTGASLLEFQGIDTVNVDSAVEDDTDSKNNNKDNKDNSSSSSSAAPTTTPSTDDTQTSSDNNSSSGSNGSSKPDCQSNSGSIPNEVCKALNSLKQNTSLSNPYMSNFQGELPNGVQLVSADEGSWVNYSSTTGAVNGKAKIPIFGTVDVQGEFKKISGSWKVINIYVF